MVVPERLENPAATVSTLSELLRYTLNGDSDQEIPLENEIDVRPPAGRDAHGLAGDLGGFVDVEPVDRAQQAERSAQSWKSWWAPTNLLTMAMLAPEFHMA